MANTNKKTAKHLSLINKKKQCKVCGEHGTYQKTLFCYEHFKLHQKEYMTWRRRLKQSFWTQAFFFEQWEKQDRKCGICKTDTNNANQDWSTDHNHKTNTPRMILCHKCNTNVGIIENKGLDYVKSIVDYLEQYE